MLVGESRLYPRPCRPLIHSCAPLLAIIGSDYANCKWADFTSFWSALQLLPDIEAWDRIEEDRRGQLTRIGRAMRGENCDV